jgi:hypothetical protein
MKYLTAILTLAVMLAFGTNAFAKCYHFSDADSDVGVCVGKDGSDSFDDRKKAVKICTDKTGSDCGNVSSYSSSCHSNSGKCYDENGDAHRSLDGY